MRRTRGDPEAHIMAAVTQLVAHLVATAEDPLGDAVPVTVLARAGALVLLSKIELDGTP